MALNLAVESAPSEVALRRLFDEGVHLRVALRQTGSRKQIPKVALNEPLLRIFVSAQIRE